MQKKTAKIVLLFLGFLLCGGSLSTMFWGGFEGYGSSGKMLIPILSVLVGASVFVEYIFNKPMQLGLITVPVGYRGLRALVLCVAIFLTSLPLLIAFGIYG
ncbi:MAG: hypothetical protein KBT88_08460 [Gammaproteobacteria bacterium]|nr:hypothetical protein [Gammaproteobacteria bacterium]MBQ0839806.1 hypothetical protein [Gammaproteobacteria bacterium]